MTTRALIYRRGLIPRFSLEMDILSVKQLVYLLTNGKRF